MVDLLSGLRSPDDPLVLVATDILATRTAEQHAALVALDTHIISETNLQAQYASQHPAGPTPELIAAFHLAHTAWLDSCQLLLQWQQLEFQLTTEIHRHSTKLAECLTAGSQRPHPRAGWLKVATDHCAHASTTTTYPPPAATTTPASTPNPGYLSLRKSLFHLLSFTETAGYSVEPTHTEEYPEDLPCVKDWLFSSLHSLLWLRCSPQCGLHEQAGSLGTLWYSLAGIDAFAEVFSDTSYPAWLSPLASGPGVEIDLSPPPHHVPCVTTIDLESRRDKVHTPAASSSTPTPEPCADIPSPVRPSLPLRPPTTDGNWLPLRSSPQIRPVGIISVYIHPLSTIHLKKPTDSMDDAILLRALALMYPSSDTYHPDRFPRCPHLSGHGLPLTSDEGSWPLFFTRQPLWMLPREIRILAYRTLAASAVIHSTAAGTRYSFPSHPLFGYLHSSDSTHPYAEPMSFIISRADETNINFKHTAWMHQDHNFGQVRKFLPVIFSTPSICTAAFIDFILSLYGLEALLDATEDKDIVSSVCKVVKALLDQDLHCHYVGTRLGIYARLFSYPDNRWPHDFTTIYELLPNNIETAVGLLTSAHRSYIDKQKAALATHSPSPAG